MVNSQHTPNILKIETKTESEDEIKEQKTVTLSCSKSNENQENITSTIRKIIQKKFKGQKKTFCGIIKSHINITNGCFNKISNDIYDVMDSL